MKPSKLAGGQRRYAAEEVKRLHFIKRAQALGFSLEEIKLLLVLGNGQHCADAQRLAARKLQLIESKQAALMTMHQALSELVQRCEANPINAACPLIEALIQD